MNLGLLVFIILINISYVVTDIYNKSTYFDLSPCDIVQKWNILATVSFKLEFVFIIDYNDNFLWVTYVTKAFEMGISGHNMEDKHYFYLFYILGSPYLFRFVLKRNY